MKETQAAFWQEYPALGLGISALLGALAFFEQAVLIAALWMGYRLYLSKWRGLVHGTLVTGVALYSLFLFSDLPPAGAGRAYFSVHSVQPYSSPFQKGWLYKGTLRSFETTTQKWALSLPCCATFRGPAEERPKADGDYILVGQLQKHHAFDFAFKAKTWQKAEGTWSLAEMRYLAKEKIRSIVHRYCPDLHTSDFLTALFTGDIENRMLRFEFGRLGLQYLLVISGFHFAILASFIVYVMKWMLPPRWKNIALLAGISAYFLFVGNSPPVERSFLAAAIFLVGQLIGRRASGLNILGVCLLFEIIMDPLIVRNIGFQLTFLSCFGIFLLSPLIRRRLQNFFPLRTLPEIQAMHLPSQGVYIISTFLSRALSLTLAVNLALWPLLLVHFHRFPFLSLLYNLFAPGLTALSLFALLTALSVYALFPLFSIPLFHITDTAARSLLALIANPPAVLDYGLSARCPGWTLAPYIIFLFLIIIYERRKSELPFN
jgi:competence protein ComEC